MDIWERLFETAKKQYYPEEVTSFVYTHHSLCALESDNEKNNEMDFAWKDAME